MKKSSVSRYSDKLIQFAASKMEFTNGVLHKVLLLALGYFIWIFSPNKFIAIIIMLSTTILPVYSSVFVVDKICRVAIMLRRKYPSVVTDAFYSALKFLSAAVLVLYGKLIHGFELHGEENLPKDKGALLIYHHANFVYDVFYILSKRTLQGGTVFGGIMDRDLCRNLPGVCEFFNFYSERQRLVECLKKGHHCAVAPGGGPEATLSKDYELYWCGRIGFAEVAKQCGIPVIPMFTVNSQQSMPLQTYGFYDFIREMHQRTKKYLYLPLISFPVKLRTYYGKPLYCGVDESPAEFAERVKAAIYELRDKHQRQPGSILLALLERIGFEAFDRDSHQKEL